MAYAALQPAAEQARRTVEVLGTLLRQFPAVLTRRTICTVRSFLVTSLPCTQVQNPCVVLLIGLSC